MIHSIIEIHSVAKDGVEATASTVRSNLVRVREDRTSDAYAVEDDAGVIVGYGVVHWVPFLFLAGGEAYITELFIRPADTGRKLGSTLIAHIVAEAKRRGCSRLSLLNGRDGASYHREFYRKLGWIEREQMANFVFKLGKNAQS
ncbi:MAG TPA: GNAT family N-acetyltransferase [Lacunisphaera sp.]